MAWIKDEPVLEETGKYERYRKNGYPISELYHGITEGTIHQRSSANGDSTNFQDELRDVNCNKFVNNKLLPHLTIVDRLELKEEYLKDEDIWFSFEWEDNIKWKSISLIREFQYNQSTKEIIFKLGHRDKTITFGEIKKMYFPRKKKGNMRLDKAMELLAKANETLNDKEIKDFLES